MATAIEKYIKELEGLKTGNQKMDTVAQAFIDRAKEYLPIEKQDLQKAWDASAAYSAYIDSGMEKSPTFYQFYSQLKGE